MENFEWRNNVNFRKSISKIGKERNVDSALILTGSPKQVSEIGYHCFMDVYEPRADSISTMCGNGIRVVCQYWIDNGFLPKDGKFLINTGSGIREIKILGCSYFSVNMGELTLDISDLKKYVKVDKFDIPERFGIKKVLLGMTGNRINGEMDGEPHLIFFLNRRSIPMKKLKECATRLGKIFTRNNKLFPLEINTSAAAQNLDGSLSICTYERGVYYVTQACGTATAVAGGYLLQKLKLRKIEIKTLGGQLIVKTDSTETIYLIGSAEPLSNINNIKTLPGFALDI